MRATVGVGEVGGVAEGMACSTHRRARGSSEFERADRRRLTVSHSPYGIRTPRDSTRMCILLLLLLNNITMARTAHIVTNLILSAVQYARYSCVTCGFSNIATSADADHAMSSRTLAHIAKESTPSLEQTLTGCLSYRLRQGSVHLSIFCLVFLEEVLQRNQVDDN